MLHYLLPGRHQVWMTDYFITLEDRWVGGGWREGVSVIWSKAGFPSPSDDLGEFPIWLEPPKSLGPYYCRCLLQCQSVGRGGVGGGVWGGVGGILERGQRGKNQVWSTNLLSKTLDFRYFKQSTTRVFYLWGKQNTSCSSDYFFLQNLNLDRRRRIKRIGAAKYNLNMLWKENL